MTLVPEMSRPALEPAESLGRVPVDPTPTVPELPASIRALRPAAMEVEARPSRATPIEVLYYRPTHSDYPGLLAKPGTVTLFVAKQGAAILPRVRRAVESGTDDDRVIAGQLTAQFRQRSMVSIEEAVATLLRQPVFATLRYGDRTLAQNLFAPDGLDACVVPMAYNGGYVDEHSFKLVEHFLPDSDERLEAVAVVHSPPLTPAERAALRAVPPDQREWSIGQPMACYAITAVTIVAVVIAATYACPGIVEPEAMPEKEIKAIGPAATARKLLAIRRRVLEGG